MTTIFSFLLIEVTSSAQYQNNRFVRARKNETSQKEIVLRAFQMS